MAYLIDEVKFATSIDDLQENNIIKVSTDDFNAKYETKQNLTHEFVEKTDGKKDSTKATQNTTELDVEAEFDKFFELKKNMLFFYNANKEKESKLMNFNDDFGL